MNEKAMTLSQFAARWGVDRHTAARWIAPFEDELGPHGNLFTPRQVQIIIAHIE